MEKVCPWCDQPSDRGRIKNRIEQNRTMCTGNDLISLMSTNKGTVNARNVRNVNSCEQSDKIITYI